MSVRECARACAGCIYFCKRARACAPDAPPRPHNRQARLQPPPTTTTLPRAPKHNSKTHALGDAKVDERCLRRDLGLVVRVGQLGREVQAKPWVVLDLGVAHLHHERAPAPHGDLADDRVEHRVDLGRQVFEQQRRAGGDAREHLFGWGGGCCAGFFVCLWCGVDLRFGLADVCAAGARDASRPALRAPCRRSAAPTAAARRGRLAPRAP